MSKELYVSGGGPTLNFGATTVYGERKSDTNRRYVNIFYVKETGCVSSSKNLKQTRKKYFHPINVVSCFGYTPFASLTCRAFKC